MERLILETFPKNPGRMVILYHIIIYQMLWNITSGRPKRSRRDCNWIGHNGFWATPM